MNSALVLPGNAYCYLFEFTFTEFESGVWMIEKLLVKICFYIINVKRALGDGVHNGMLEKNICDNARLAMECLKEEPKVGKGKD